MLAAPPTLTLTPTPTPAPASDALSDDEGTVYEDSVHATAPVTAPVPAYASHPSSSSPISVPLPVTAPLPKAPVVSLAASSSTTSAAALLTRPRTLDRKQSYSAMSLENMMAQLSEFVDEASASASDSGSDSGSDSESVSDSDSDSMSTSKYITQRTDSERDNWMRSRMRGGAVQQPPLETTNYARQVAQSPAPSAGSFSLAEIRRGSSPCRKLSLDEITALRQPMARSSSPFRSVTRFGALKNRAASPSPATSSANAHPEREEEAGTRRKPSRFLPPALPTTKPATIRQSPSPSPSPDNSAPSSPALSMAEPPRSLASKPWLGPRSASEGSRLRSQIELWNTDAEVSDRRISLKPSPSVPFMKSSQDTGLSGATSTLAQTALSPERPQTSLSFFGVGSRRGSQAAGNSGNPWLFANFRGRSSTSSRMTEESEGVASESEGVMRANETELRGRRTSIGLFGKATGALSDKKWWWKSRE
ncbi:hypothetical protein HDU83_004065 [Entophlyctis luteolus]|nr:hypothetical protein HDU83_004065 [Entophlyctis luteolus]